MTPATSSPSSQTGKVNAARSGDGRHALPNRAKTPCARIALLAVITIHEAARAPGVTNASSSVNASRLDPLSSTNWSIAGAKIACSDVSMPLGPPRRQHRGGECHEPEPGQPSGQAAPADTIRAHPSARVRANRACRTSKTTGAA